MDSHAVGDVRLNSNPASPSHVIVSSPCCFCTCMMGKPNCPSTRVRCHPVLESDYLSRFSAYVDLPCSALRSACKITPDSSRAKLFLHHTFNSFSESALLWLAKMQTSEGNSPPSAFTR